MPPEKSEARLFIRDDRDNTVLNWHGDPAQEFHMYGEAFRTAAKKLLANDELDRLPIASFDASVIVYLYRHALELFMKEILIGRGSELIDPRPTAETVLNAGHSLIKLLPDVRRIFAACGWDNNFGTSEVRTFDDFSVIVQEFEKADPSSFSFRYPTRKNLSAALHSHFTFSVRKFASIMDEILATLSSACDYLAEIANNEAEAKYEAYCEGMSYGEPDDY